MLTSARRGEALTPNPNECNSTLTSGTNNIYPYPYIDVNDRGHRLRITHMPRWIIFFTLVENSKLWRSGQAFRPAIYQLGVDTPPSHPFV